MSDFLPKIVRWCRANKLKGSPWKNEWGFTTTAIKRKSWGPGKKHDGPHTKRQKRFYQTRFGPVLKTANRKELP